VSIRDRMLQWSFYHRALGVQRLYVPEQPFFFQEEEYTDCEAFVYRGWTLKGPTMFPAYLYPKRYRDFSKNLVDTDMRLRFNFCMHEYYRDDYILMELSVDEFLVCPAQTFVCAEDFSSKSKLDTPAKSCFGSDKFSQACRDNCEVFDNASKGGTVLINSTHNRMEHPQVCFSRLLMAPGDDDDVAADSVYGKSWDKNMGFKGQPKCMCNPARFYRAAVHGCRFDGFSSIYEGGLECVPPSLLLYFFFPSFFISSFLYFFLPSFLPALSSFLLYIFLHLFLPSFISSFFFLPSFL
jgi:hypothetical protein